MPRTKTNRWPQVTLTPTQEEALFEAMRNYRKSTGEEISWPKIVREYGVAPFVKKYAVDPHSKQKTAHWPEEKAAKRGKRS